VGWCVGLLEGKSVNLTIMEQEDLPLLAEWDNSLEFRGEHLPVHQSSIAEMEKSREPSPFELKTFIVEKKDGSKIGYVSHYYMLHPSARVLEIGYGLVPTERGKGYCSEAVKIMVDYLFLSKDAVRIQAHTDVRNVASQKVLEKAGFKKEGILRKTAFVRGKWEDYYVYGILREEWKEPKILTKTG
jgi:RimJ/RimL family protein N-acetyltransferase